jgi:putative aldouronate transport system permease protein
LEEIMGLEYEATTSYAPESLIYAMIVCAIIPIIIIYPYIQKYFAKGVNVGGVKE